MKNNRQMQEICNRYWILSQNLNDTTTMEQYILIQRECIATLNEWKEYLRDKKSVSARITETLLSLRTVSFLIEIKRITEGGI